MKQPSKNVWLAGVDGCKGGWVVAFGQLDGKTQKPRFVSTIDEIVYSDERPAIIAIDVPIGLPKCSPVGGRGPEPELRKILKGRASSVFRVPSRSTIYAGLDVEFKIVRSKYTTACEMARTTSKDGMAFALQSFYIFDKIASVDTFLRAHPDCVSSVHETHPELAFYYMNGCVSVFDSKKSKKGIEVRGRLLKEAGISDETIIAPPPMGAKRDDAIDSLACLVTARRIGKKLAKCHPEPPCKDEHGLPIAVWA
jgi:predicted RNase H-like nuclease